MVNTMLDHSQSNWFPVIHFAFENSCLSARPCSWHTSTAYRT